MALCATTAPSTAFEIFGVRLFGREDGPPPPADAVAYEPALTVTGAEGLTKPLRGASRLVADNGEPVVGPPGLLARARGDYQRLLGILYANGHYGGTISITVDGREAADIPIDATFGETANVAITVDTGPVYLFDSISIKNRPGVILDDNTLPKTPEELGLRTGETARSTAVLDAESALVGRWREAGHPKARIGTRTASARHRAEAVDVAIVAEPGRRAVFGESTVEGTDRMDPGFVAYYADLPEGEQFDPDDIERARDQLRRLEVFQATRVVEADAVTDEGTLPILFSVAERKRRVVGGGVEFSSIDGVGVEGYWRHRNLFGRAEKLRLEGRVGGINADDPDEYNYRIAAAFLAPGIGTPYTDVSARVWGEQLAPDTFRARTAGVRAGVSHRFTPRLQADAFLQAEAATIDRTRVGDGEFFTLSAPMAINYDGSNNALDPTSGFRVGLKAEPFVETVNANLGVVSEAELSAYYGFANDRIVLAGRVQAASILGTPLDETPANRLYFAGGGDSIRGYPYKEVGPRDAQGRIVGGRSVFTASAEVRARITESFGAVAFADAGNAFSSQLPDFSEPLKVGVGLGIRYYTGLGPIRLDVGVPLSPNNGDPAVAVYIGLGQAF